MGRTPYSAPHLLDMVTYNLGLLSYPNATIPVSIAALYVMLSTFTYLPPFQQGFRARYEPPHLPYHLYLSLHYSYINLMHFSAHFAGPLHRSALIHHHLLHPLLPLDPPPKYHINPFSNSPPTHTTSKLHPLPTIPLNLSIHQPHPHSNQHTPPYINISFTPSNPSFTTHNTSPSTLIAMSHPNSPYPALLSITTLNLSYP